jgi:hypothetical protein
MALMLPFAIGGCGQVDNQSANLTPLEIEDYLKKVDTDKTLTEKTTSGFIEYEGQTGRFETQSLFDPHSKLLYRIRHHESTDTTLNLTFYYRQNKLIYSKAERWHFSNNEYKSDYEKEVYFSGEQVILEKGNRMSSRELSTIGLNFLKAHNDRYSKGRN